VTKTTEINILTILEAISPQSKYLKIHLLIMVLFLACRQAAASGYVLTEHFICVLSVERGHLGVSHLIGYNGII
jgi:hypothetical protein